MSGRGAHRGGDHHRQDPRPPDASQPGPGRSAAARTRLHSFAELYDRSASTVYGVLRHRLGPRRAELATERIYLQLWRSADFDVTGSVATLLLELVRRHLTDPVEQPRAPRR